MENISHTKSDTFIKNISFKDSTGIAIDITASTIVFSVKNAIDDIGTVLQQVFTLTDPTNWLAMVQIDAANMNLAVWTYLFDIQWTDWTWIVKTVMKGNFIITYEITT